MLKTTNEEFAVVGYNENNQPIIMAGQFKAKDCKEYFASLCKNFGGGQ